MKDRRIKYMNTPLVAFIASIIMLFSGIGIMMQPTKLVTVSQSNSSILGALITLGSFLTIAGLVGMGVVGFIFSKGEGGSNKVAS
jgi:hypothetical protein